MQIYDNYLTNIKNIRQAGKKLMLYLCANTKGINFASVNNERGYAGSVADVCRKARKENR